MPCQFYRNPALVDAIFRAFARWHGEDKARAMLASGVEVDEIFLLLRDTPGVDTHAILLAALTSGDFATVPKVGPVRAVRLRRTGRLADTHLDNFDGVNLFTDSGIVAGDRVLLRLLPPSPDPESALVRFLIVNPDATREEALKAVRNEFPDFAKRAFDRFWSQARKAASLPARAPPGAKRKQK